MKLVKIPNSVRAISSRVAQFDEAQYYMELRGYGTQTHEA